MSKLNVTFTTQAFKDYQFWQQHNLGNFKKLTLYLKVSHEMVASRVSKPEALKVNYEGYYSRRITIEHRLVYKIKNDSIL